MIDTDISNLSSNKKNDNGLFYVGFLFFYTVSGVKKNKNVAFWKKIGRVFAVG